MSVPYTIVDRNGMAAAIVPEHIVAQVMTSALVPNMGYRMECRPATEEEIYQLLYQLEQNRPPLPERSVRYRTISGVGQQLVVVMGPVESHQYPA
ncbi:hypothetical protein P1A145kb_p157 [Pectobacterium phage DU_PP_I]|nr:hypothetical protein P1A145kb_p157 [Pectobacterium phage DU_PP_I]ATS93874.1 hypothetical protein P12B145kb_p158 [Pectobacterium phage DU_PP_IV]